MIWIIAGLIVVAIIAMALSKLANKKEDTSEYPYQKKDVLFTPAERSFLGVLNQAVGEDVRIFGKVRVADVVTTKRGLSNSKRQKAFNKISAKHFDFLLCNKNDLSIICAVELNDRSHQSDNRQDRDVLIDGICKASGIPLIQTPAKAAYNINEIKQLLGPNLNIPSFSSQEGKEALIERTPTTKKCPKCSSPMVKRVAKKGDNAGKQFWACSAFPKCRHIEAVVA